MLQTLIDPAFLAAKNGGTPVLDLNFAALKSLDSRITFARASTGTFINSAGLVETASAGVARFTHDPATLESLGLLVEGSRTNLLLNSATLSTQNVTVSATDYTLSFTGTGSITRSGTSTGTLSGIGDGEANRVTVTFTPSAGTLTLTISGTVTNAQIEAGAFATSYIPTTSAAVTRAADVATMTGTNFSSWYNQTEGTVAVDFLPTINTQLKPVFSTNDGTTAQRISFKTLSAQCNLRAVSSSVNIDATAGTLTESPVKCAIAYGPELTCVVAGQSIFSQSTASTPIANRLEIGAEFGSSILNSSIARFRYFNRRLPASSLQALST